MINEAESIKHRRYDPGMSRRTRKPQVVVKTSLDQDEELPPENNSIHSSSISSLNHEELLKDCNGVYDLSLSSLDQDDALESDSNGTHRSSLKELMFESNGLEKIVNTEIEQNDEVVGDKKEVVLKGKSGLALVSMQGEGLGGVKKGGMVSRYVKVLSHLIKAKRDSKKKSAVRLLKP